MNRSGIVYLIPSKLDERSVGSIPSSIPDAIKKCEVFFVENERSARRYLKQIWKEIVIDDYEWHTIHKVEKDVVPIFIQKLKQGKTVGIISEAGCPGIADPGQLLVAAAQEMNVVVKPLVGPVSMILTLMASGMNGQHFRFVGYLPIDNLERIKMIGELETESQKRNCTQIFIETPYRNNQLVDTLLKKCKPATRLCIGVDLTSPDESIRTKTVSQWQQSRPDIHKHPAIFLLYAGT
jgi:16S rRNA (cytidine1402-2'-O)-methyltransferase